MEASEEKSPLKNERLHLDSGFQSDQADPLINDNKLIEGMTRELEKMAIDETLNRDFPEHLVVPDEECEVKRMIDEEVYNLVMEAVHEDFRVESSSEGGRRKSLGMGRLVDEALAWADVKKFLEGESMECRVLEEREVGENGSGHGKDVKEVDGGDDDDDKLFEHKDDDLKEIHAVNFEGEHASVEVMDNEYDDEENRSENGKGLGNKSENAGGGESGSIAVQNDGRPKNYHYPLRPDAEDCSFYVRTGMCKFESNCKFNHPLRRRNQPSKETVKQMKENSDRPGQIDCKYYLSSGGCKYGKACKYSHSRGKTVVAPAVEYNFLGLPIRLGEQECPYYMRNGSCKYGPTCRFNHPDPTAVGGGDAPAAYGNGGSLPFQSASQTTMSSWAAPRNMNEAAPFVPVMYSPTHGMPPPNPHWNGYQAPGPVYPSSERSLPTPPAFFINNPPSDANLYTHQMPVSEFPERPGQIECSYYMKTGDCKYRSACKFHHPRNRIPKTAPSAPTNKGLPFRPDKNICTHYSQYGICKYGPGCKYDHPVYYSNSGGAYQPNGSNDPSLIQHSM